MVCVFNITWVPSVAQVINLGKCLKSYSETGCSFTRHFAIFSGNVGILIGSLLQASCKLNFQLAALWSSSVAVEVKAG